MCVCVCVSDSLRIARAFHVYWCNYSPERSLFMFLAFLTLILTTSAVRWAVLILHWVSRKQHEEEVLRKEQEEASPASFAIARQMKSVSCKYIIQCTASRSDVSPLSNRYDSSFSLWQVWDLDAPTFKRRLQLYVRSFWNSFENHPPVT